jgi:hypothetical protein
MQHFLEKERIVRVPLLLILTLVLCAGALFPCLSFGQESLPEDEPLPRVALGVKASTLGIGIEAATAVTQRSNVRGGFNFFNYTNGADWHGINYDVTLTLRSAQVIYDQYILGGFHVSPGLLVYNGNGANAIVSVPAGQHFSLGGVTYHSNPADPIRGTETLKIGKAAPMVLLGFGNLLPRPEAFWRQISTSVSCFRGRRI